jgi:hypothetical protein
MLGESVRTMYKNTEVWLVVSKEISLEANYEKTKYMAMYHEHTAGPNHDINIGNISCETAE